MPQRPENPVGPAATLPTGLLMKEVRNLVGAVGERTLGRVVDRVSATTDRLNEYATTGGRLGSPGQAAKKAGGAGASVLKKAAGGALTGVAKGAVQSAAGTARKAVGGVLGDGGQPPEAKVTNIVEEIDVGVPVSVAYNQWTQFADFPSFMRKVETVEQQSDEKLRWQARILWSHRTWESTISEQVPDERIVWRSTGDKGYVDGAVTFHELAPDLTRIVLVLEYHPQGLFERIGNLWRAQGRRARSELRHFQRHVMTRTILHPDEVEGWRGEIRDSRVVDEQEEPAGRRERADGPEDSEEQESRDEGPPPAGRRGARDTADETRPSRRRARQPERPQRRERTAYRQTDRKTTT